MQILANYGKQNFKLEDVSTPTLHNRPLKERYVHSITLVKNSKLFEILGSDHFEVNSFHQKQVIEPNKKPVAFSSDGVIEAVELENYPFCIGVQCI